MTEISPAPSSFGMVFSRLLRGLTCLALGLLVLYAPLKAPDQALRFIGLMVVINGILEFGQFYGARSPQGQRATLTSAGLSILSGVVLMNAPQLAKGALLLLIGGSFLLDGVVALAAAARGADNPRRRFDAAIGFVNLLIGLAMLARWPISGIWLLAGAFAYRLIATGIGILLARHAALPTDAIPDWQDECHPNAGLGLPHSPVFTKLRDNYYQNFSLLHGLDWSFILSFLAIFFAIHLGRMRVSWNLVGFFSPAVAVLGDIAVALLITYVAIVPAQWLLQRGTRVFERRAWLSLLPRLEQGEPLNWLQRLRLTWLQRRLHSSRRRYEVNRSPIAAFRHGLVIGLPFTAILIATAPIWGFTWFFNSENWVAQIWHTWAEHRTDTWRAAMMHSVEAAMPLRPDRLHAPPPGVENAEDFSFIVIGDPGEGDASQLCLHDRLLAVGNQPDHKFLVISSDVIYPNGEMIDFEHNFYLPFKGYQKPIYAMPGNHDWYDALEGFNANFLEPTAARAAMLARIEVDNRLTTTRQTQIDRWIDEAARWRRAYELQAALQQAPYFSVHSPRFALIVVDTGVVRRLDDVQYRWLRSELERARGKFIMMVLGHPFYTMGVDQGIDDPEFGQLHDLLKEYRVPVVMAGDTHDFEYYRERYQADGAPQVQHHFVNGGGGAFLSISTALEWDQPRPVPDCAVYPRGDQLRAKLENEVNWFKRPFWWWVKYLNGWPATVELFSGAFNFNYAPFYQSFVEVKVEGSRNRVRLIAHGVNGPLHWEDLQIAGAVIPPGQKPSDPVEFVVPMRPR